MPAPVTLWQSQCGCSGLASPEEAQKWVYKLLVAHAVHGCTMTCHANRPEAIWQTYDDLQTTLVHFFPDADTVMLGMVQLLPRSIYSANVLCNITDIVLSSAPVDRTNKLFNALDVFHDHIIHPWCYAVYIMSTSTFSALTFFQVLK